MKTACAYIRVSTDMQDEYSPDAQVRLIKEYAEKNDIILAHVYKDIGISGRTTDKRPEFNQMIADCKSKEHPYDYILVWKFSRFARNQEESIVYKRMLRKDNVEVQSISEPLPEGFVGELVERIFEWMDEYYSINLAQEVKRGMTEKALKGEYNSRFPMGYSRIDGKPVVNDYAPVIKLIFDLFTEEDMSLTGIEYELMDRGIKTPNGKLWYHTRLRYILSNPFYAGYVRWDADVAKYHYVEAGIIAKADHEPIVSYEQYQKAVDKIKRITPKLKNAPNTYFLSGIIKCSKCGGSMTRHFARSTVQMICLNASKRRCDTRNTITYPKLEKMVIDALKEVTYDVTLKKREKSVIDNSELIKKLETKLSRAKDAYLNGVDSITEYKKTKENIEEQIAKLKKIPKPSITQDDIKTLHSLLDSDDDLAKRHAMLKIVDHFVYDRETNTLEMYLKE